jgi:hypothetical protein
MRMYSQVLDWAQNLSTEPCSLLISLENRAEGVKVKQALRQKLGEGVNCFYLPTRFWPLIDKVMDSDKFKAPSLKGLKGAEIWVVHGLVNAQDTKSFQQNPSFLWEQVIELIFSNLKDNKDGANSTINLVGGLVCGSWLNQKELYSHYDMSFVKERPSAYMSTYSLNEGVQAANNNDGSFESFQRNEHFYSFLRLLDKKLEDENSKL